MFLKRKKLCMRVNEAFWLFIDRRPKYLLLFYCHVLDQKVIISYVYAYIFYKILPLEYVVVVEVVKLQFNDFNSNKGEVMIIINNYRY